LIQMQQQNKHNYKNKVCEMKAPNWQHISTVFGPFVMSCEHVPGAYFRLSTVSPNYCFSLISSIPHRLQDVI